MTSQIRENALFFTCKISSFFFISFCSMKRMNKTRGYRYIQGIFSFSSFWVVKKISIFVSAIKLNSLQRFSFFHFLHPYRVGFAVKKTPTHKGKILCKVSVILLCKLKKIMSKILRTTKQNAVCSYNLILSNLGFNWLSNKFYGINWVYVYNFNLIRLEPVFYAK